MNIGDNVLVDSDAKKRINWPLASVREPFRGPDEYIRMIKLKTKEGETTCPVKRLYALELSSPELLTTKAFETSKDKTFKH